jgi:23S rRNA pseudouridine955/2504/2580 synthase
VRTVEISPGSDGQRIDNFLVRELKGVPKSRIYRMLRSGEVRVNGGRRKPSDRLATGDRVRIPPVREGVREAVFAPSGLIERIEQSVLAEDDLVMIINKEGGLAVHGGSGVKLGLIEALRQGRPDAPYLELVHRLDREASGCLVIAKSRAALLALHDAFKLHEVDKRYRVLLKGQWTGGARTVELPLSQVRTGEEGRSSVVAEDGKAAESVFTPVEQFSGAVLMEVRIRTGRMHQIRAHASHIGYPLAGDDRYGDFVFNREMRKLGLKRMFLHAYSLRFQLDGKRHAVQAPLDASLNAFLERLRGGA